MYYIISYTGLWQGTWSHVPCQDLMYPESKAKGTYGSDREHENMYPANDLYNEFVILQILVLLTYSANKLNRYG